MSQSFRKFSTVASLIFFVCSLLLVDVSILNATPIFDDNEPPINSFLADSIWSMCHRNAYSQGSSPYPGPDITPADQEEDFLLGRPGTVTANFSAPYSDGGHVIWASCKGQIFKADPEGSKLKYIDRIESESFQWIPDFLASWLGNLTCPQTNCFLSTLMGDLIPGPTHEGETVGASGIYPVLGSDGTFYQPLGKEIIAYGDVIEGDRFSPIEKKGVYQIPDEILPKEWDRIVGMVLTYDGMLAFSTNYGLVGVIDRNLENAQYVQLGQDEWVFNNISADENGGIYVVSHKKMYRVQWTGSELTLDEAEGAWSAEYEAGEISDSDLDVQSSAGSGSTPSLMGTGEQDRFVVITDGSEVMNIVLFWRDEIPADWVQLPGTKDRRIAAQVPITFGDPDRVKTFSDQSVLVRGYGAFVVDNELQKYTSNLSFTKNAIANILLSGEPDRQPYGCEKFEWNPDTRKLISIWVNQEISLPNAIPTMSSATNMIYSIGARNGVWTLEVLNWDTGASEFHYKIDNRSRHNSAFAACQVGPEGDIYYGTFLGMIRIKP